MIMGLRPFIKCVIDQRGGGCQKIILLISKNDNEEGDQIVKNWWRLLWTALPSVAG